MKLFFGMMALGMIKYAPDGGSGGGTPPPAKTDAEVIADLKAQLEKLQKKDPPAPPPPDPGKGTLNDQVEADRKKKEQELASTKATESAMKFTLRSAEFLKENESILPSSVKEIFAKADKETYDTAIDKANAIKAGIMAEFFSVQANVDRLTASQKTSVEDYLKLTKNGKEERATQIFENIFEPALELTKQVKKAEELTRSKSGHGNSTDAEKAYKEKMVSVSRKHYFNKEK